MAFPVVLNGRTYTLADFEGTNYVDGLPDAFEDFVTHAGDIYNDTSTSSATVGTGSKTFTVSAGKPYQAGTPLRIADAAAPETNFLDCIVTSYSGTSLVVNAFGFAGSGTKTSWTINIGGAKTIDGTLAISQGGTGATTAATARTALGLGTGDSPTFAGLTVTGSTSFSDIDIDNVGDIAVDSISGDGDADTTITFAGSDTINIAAGGSTIQSITTTGIDVTGSVTADGGLIEGSTGLTIRNDAVGANEPKLVFDNDTFAGATYGQIQTGNGGLQLLIESPSTSTFQNRHQLLLNGGGSTDVTFKLSTDNGTSYKNQLQINNNDISFYEDTGTSPKMVWKSADERLGLGTTSPSNDIHISSTSGTKALFEKTGSTGAYIGLKDSSGSLVYLGDNNGTFEVQTAGSSYSTKLAVTSAGNVGIGTSNVTGNLQIVTATAGSVLNVNHNTGGSYPKASGIGLGATSTALTVSSDGSTVSFTGGAGLYAENTAASGNPTNLVFWTNLAGTPAEAMRIDSSGQLLLGRGANVVSGAEATRIQFYNTNSTYDIASIRSEIGAGQVNRGELAFAVNNGAGQQERMKLDYSGNLLVGTTDSAPAVSSSEVGVALSGSLGYVAASRSAGASGFFNRLSDGDIVNFNKDGTTVGSIGVQPTNNLFIGGGSGDGAGIRMNSGAIFPCDSAGNNESQTKDLGQHGSYWKDFYLSGAIQFGTNSSANALDDYEEGDHTTSITCSTSGTVTLNTTFDSVSYVKVGRLVTVSGLVIVGSVSSPVGSFSISMPFSAASSGVAKRGSDSAGAVTVHNGVSANSSDYVSSINVTESALNIFLGDDPDVQTDSAQQLQTGTQIYFHISYPTN